jgi:hypothetical protein
MAETTEVNELKALLAELIKAQTAAASANGQRRIPPIDKLMRQEEFPIWRDKLIRTLRRLDLDRYILTDVPMPDTPLGKAQWRNNRADVEDYLQSVIPGHKIWSILKGMGWNSEAGDPKATFDKITQYFEKGSADSNVKMLQEMATIRRGNFDKMDGFQLRINYLKERISKTDFHMNDKAYTWLVLKGIATEYPEVYSRLVVNIQNNNLDWGDLMAELQEIAVVETAHPTMTNITKGNKDTGNKEATNNTNNNTGNDAKGKTEGKRGPSEPCDTCPKLRAKGAKHCKTPGCDRHHKGPYCWWCHPEHAPEDWPNKAEAVKRKAEKTATTAPLHQQSGITNPGNVPATNAGNKTNPRPSNLLFSTEMGDITMLNLPAFQQGPHHSS